MKAAAPCSGQPPFTNTMNIFEIVNPAGLEITACHCQTIFKVIGLKSIRYSLNLTV